MTDIEDWAELHGYVRINCRIHGRSWSDVGACEQCMDEMDEEATLDDEERDDAD